MAASPLLPLPRKLHSANRLQKAAGAADRLAAVSRLTRRRGRGYAVAGVSRDTLIRLIDYPELPLRIHTRDTIKAGRSALLVRGEFPIAGRMVPVAYKRVKRRGAIKMLSAWLFGNRALRTWRMAQTLDRLGLPTARPLMVVVPRWFQPRAPSYLAYEWLDQARNLTAYSEWLELLTPYEAKHRLHAAAQALGDLLGKMHAARVSHRDLKAGNLLLVDRPASVEAFVIDLDGARRYLWLPRYRRMRDLSRLVLATDSDKAITHAARLRFLLAYLRATGEEVQVWKSHWRRLTRMAQQRRSKKNRQERNRR